MIRNFLTSAYRNFYRHRFFSLLNILGLSIGLSATMLLTLFVWQESTYDNFHSKKDRIVRLTMDFKYNDQQAEAPVTGALVAPTFSEELPEVEKAIRFARFPVVVQKDDVSFEEDRFLFADSTLFDIFSFQLIKGNPNEALNGPKKLVLTKSTAKKYFGEEDPIGKIVTVNDKAEYMVTGVIEDAPANSQIKYDLIGSFASLGAYKNPVWFNANYHTYLLLHNESSINGFESKISDFMKTKSEQTGMTGDNYLTFRVMPLEDVHTHSKLSGLEPNIDIRYIYIFGGVAILVLLIACINYINLATARAVERGVEVGIRKVLGANKGSLFLQYLNEAFISVLVAFIIAGFITWVTLPSFNFMLNREYTFDMFLEPEVFIGLLAIILIISLGAGSYPSMVMSRFTPSKTLRGSFKSSASGLTLRRVLIVFQFAISAALIICSLIIYKQLSFIQNSNLGYQKDHVIFHNIDRQVVSKMDVLRGAFDQIPTIEEVTMAYETPTAINWSDGMNKHGEQPLMITANPVERNYLNALNIKLLAGKDFSEADQAKAYSDSAYYLHQKERSIIVNQKAAESLGWSAEEAIGQKVNFKGNSTIIGVTENFHFAPMHEEVGPLVLFLDNMYHTMMIRVDGNNIQATLDAMGNVWNEVATHIPFNPQFMDEEYNTMYTDEQRLGQLSLFFTVMTIILGCIGLLGLSALMISHRTQEIGIRKVLGASIPQIVSVLSKDFIKLVLVAFLIAIPLSWYAIDLWLQGFAYRIEMPYFIYPVAGILLLILTLLTLSTQTIKAALQNPAEVLKKE